MKDISYEILDGLKAYGADRQALDRILSENSRPEFLYALSDMRENLLEWMEFTGTERVLQLGSDYGALTGLLAGRCAQVTVADERDENLAVSRRRNADRENIVYVSTGDTLHAGAEGESSGQENKKEETLKALEGPWDVIVVLGPKRGTDLNLLFENLAGRLAGKGRLIFACENTLGLPFLSGEEHDEEESAFTRKEIEAACAKAGLCHREFYYPVPEYRLPVSIYSDRRLPAAGDIGTYPACHGPRYACTDEGKAYEQLIREGIFEETAKGFLVCASREELRERTIFVKYNRTRKEAFRIRTSICEEEGGLWVEKRALSPAGEEHIRSMERKYEQLKRTNPGVSVLAPQYGAAGDESQSGSGGKNTEEQEHLSVRFAFVRGRTLADALAEELREEAAGRGETGAPGEAAAGRREAGVPAGQKLCLWKAQIEAALDRVLGKAEKTAEGFQPTEGFKEVFGETVPLKDASYAVSNVDGLFENIIETEDGLVCLDYEWVFDFPIPAGFIKYRLLFYFYRAHAGLLEELGCASQEEFLKEFGIGKDLAAVYAGMEEAFQAWVHGDASQGILANYVQKTTSLSELKTRDAELARAKDRILQLQAEVEEKNLQIRKEQEVQRLTNNHVANLEIMIKDLRHEIDELGKLASYLNRHEALIFKGRRKLGAAANRVFPKGTRKRKVLDYGISTVKHPIRYGRLYATREGRSRIEGDFAIGQAYFDRGMLEFAQVPGEGREGPEGWEGPLVSIVIPCYNQVHYTYACLASILDHTGDVAYEVIIADDVSTDATKDLDKYVKGLVIRRNKTNQGFLLNCNQAAQAARGKYILFLNNDTQVTEGWLSSLVKLIESDSTIGMVGSKLVYPDGRLQEAGGIIWSDGSGWNYGRMDDPDKPEYNYVKDVDYISGASIMIRRELWEQIGGFDVRYTPAYCEDADLAFEVRKAGYRVVYQPLSKVIHFEGVSNGTDVNGTGLKRYQVENFKKLKEKWAEEFKNQYVNDGNPNPFRARERSRGKRIILVVDHYVPTYDRDAGSKATFLYMKMFLKKGFVVKFLGDNFQHEEPYTTTLEQMGIEVLYGDSYAAGIWDWLKKNGNEIAVAYLNRPHIATKYVDYIRDYTSMKVIYFGHDLHFLRLTREYELTGDIDIKREADYWKSMELTMMYKADMTYYPSSVEIEVIRSIDASIRAKAISLYVYDTFLENIDADYSKRENIMFVGGFAHPPNADAVLWFAREIFPLVRRQLPDVKFLVAGSKVTDEIRALETPESGIVIKGFVTDEELADMYASTKLVAVPLRYGAGVKGKILEALYNGAAVVTTSIGAEGIPFVETALEIADEAEAFAEKITALYQDNDRLGAMCRRSQEYIREYFSLDGAWKNIEEDFS